MRVVAGIARSVPLIAPKGYDVRPTADRFKETLFNLLQGEVGGKIAVDVFAGSGALGIEALSRGAERVYFCEKNRSALGCIQKNLEKTKLIDGAVIIPGDYKTGLMTMKKDRKKADLVFLDPPYFEEKNYEESICFLLEHDLLNVNAMVVMETKIDFDFSFLKKYDTITIEKEKKFKTNQYLLIRFKNGE